ncbi:aminopeptidase P family protein [Desertihabitans brevis]|uniref:Aminopeptidase P family protein n=1 Tax=Desertihabitans brevis TaxID=2268447 RepID=A0A367YU73_9ACTN|nr:Xaa-Pro peptidase family protein [Desertihabitans brevis]RCK69079.1 aminopeptidase P family protein [Desertihabitans brevis]
MTPVFTREEQEQRLQRFQTALQQQSLDLAVVNTPENICWLTGHETSGYYTYQCLVVPADGEPTLLLRETEVVNGEQTTYLSDVRGFADVEDPLQRTSELVREHGGGARVGLESRSWFFVPEHHARLTALLDGAEVVAVDQLVAQLRVVKSAAEIDRLRAAAAITNAGVRAAALAAVPGARERDVAAVALSTMVSAGSEYLGMEPFVASGPRAGNIHASWSDRVIHEGEGVLLEMAASVGRYHAPLMHTVWSGDLDPQAAAMAEACQAARDATVALVRPGHTPAEAHARCRETIDSFGLLHTYRKRSGYSVGIAFAPDWGEGHILSLQETEHRQFQPGMVVHVVPTLRLAGRAGQGFSATVLVTAGEPEVLTRCDARPGSEG